jgi:hypothetical protein
MKVQTILNEINNYIDRIELLKTLFVFLKLII